MLMLTATPSYLTMRSPCHVFVYPSISIGSASILAEKLKSTKSVQDGRGMMPRGAPPIPRMLCGLVLTGPAASGTAGTCSASAVQKQNPKQTSVFICLD